MGLPVVVAQVSGLGHELLLTQEVRFECLRLQTVSEVNVTADLLAFVVLVPYKYNRSEFAVADEFFSLF